MAGFFPLGLAYGILMLDAGYNFLWTGFTSVIVLAGSLQFLMLDFFAGGVPIVTIIVMALLLNSRHIFYGLSFIEKFREYGPRKYFMIYTLADENYSLLCSYKAQEGTNAKTVNIMSSALVAFYWIVFSMLGGLVGRLITFDTTGIEFALTALFVVILLEQMKGAKNLLPVVIAAVSSVSCILAFGASDFILPSLVITVAALLFLRPRLETKTVEKECV
jgi:4-azaleucine resistance transporter AzlC